MLIGRDPGAIEDIWKLLYKGACWRGGPIQKRWPIFYFENGYLKSSDAPGLGGDIDEALAAKYLYQRHYLPIPRREDGSVHGY